MDLTNSSYKNLPDESFKLKELLIESYDKNKEYLREINNLKSKLLNASIDNSHNISSNTSSPAFILNKNLCIISWNNAAEKILYFNQDEIIGQNINFIIPENLITNFEVFLKNAFNGKQYNNISLSCNNKLGDRINFNSSIFPVMDAEANISSIFISNKIINEKLSCSGTINQGMDCILDLIENFSQILIQFTNNSKISYINKAGKQIFGFNDNEILGIYFQDLVFDEDLTKVNSLIEKVRKNEPADPMVINFRSKDGFAFELLVHLSSHFTNNIFEGYSAFLTEIIAFKEIGSKEKEDNKKYHEVFHTISDGLIYTTKSGLVLDVNPAFLDITGLTKDEIVGKNAIFLARKFLKLNDIPKVIDYINKNMRSERLGIERFNIEYRDKILEITPLTKVSTIGGAAIIRDITLLIKSREALAKSEAQYKLVVENAHESIFIIQDKKIVFANQKLANDILYTLEEIHTTSFDKFIHPDTRPNAVENYINRLKGLNIGPSHHKILRKDDSFLWAEFNGVRIDDYNGKPAVLYFAKDVTESVMAREALKESEAKYTKLMKSLNEGVLVIDDEANITFANSKICELLGYDNNEILDSQLVNFIDNDSLENAEKFFEIQKNGTSLHHELTLKHKKGWQIHTIFQSAPLLDDNSEYIGSISGVIDITDRKNAQDALISSQKQLEELNNSKDRFFSIIAHDLKSPLSGFLSLTKMIALDFKNISVKELHQLAKALYESALKLNKLLENLLEWSRIQRGLIEYDPVSANISELINDDISLFNVNIENKNISISNNINPDLCAYVDTKMFNTVFRNLISNAVKYTKNGGLIEFNSDYIEDSLISIYVKDNGTGMTPDLINKLFKIGEQVAMPGTENEQGSGLGLVLCKELLNKMGGDIFVESEIDKGSKFSFTLPVKI